MQVFFFGEALSFALSLVSSYALCNTILTVHHYKLTVHL